MKGRILVPAEEVWDYIQDQFALFCSDDPNFTGWDLAYNDDAGTEVSVDFDGVKPMLVVSEDEEQIMSVPVSKADCEETAQSLYDDFISDRVFGRYTGHDSDDPMVYDDPPEAYSSEDDEIDERETELTDAVLDLLTVVLGDELDSYDIEKLIEDTKDKVCEWLTTEYDADIRRPMWLENDEGEERYVEYPYDLLLEAAG